MKVSCENNSFHNAEPKLVCHGAIARGLIVAILLSFVVCCSSVWAQKDTGAISGTVKDSSGAVVVGAKVRVTDVDRGTDIVTVTNEVGEYTVSPLKVGHYKVTVEKAGFRTAIAGPLVV